MKAKARVKGKGKVKVKGKRSTTAPSATAPTTTAPITPALAASWRSLVFGDRGRAPNVFSKIGASNTVNRNFATCLDNTGVLLDGRDLDDTRLFFSAGNAGGTSPWDRVSASATVGWSSHMPLRGDPRPLDVEFDAANPAFAVIMYGTNDIQLGSIQRTADDMLALIDAHLAAGVPAHRPDHPPARRQRQRRPPGPPLRAS